MACVTVYEIWGYEMNEALLNLPWQIQVALASGGAAYLLAYRGLRASHKAFDATFISLIFSLIASVGLYLLPQLSNASGVRMIGQPFVVGAVAFLLSCFAAICWRKVFRALLAKKLKDWNVTWSNDDFSAITTVTLDEGYNINQIIVDLDDGTRLKCDDTRKFKDLPFGPVMFGQNGDVAFYITHIISPDKQTKEINQVSDPIAGDRITCVPANRIVRMSMKIKKEKDEKQKFCFIRSVHKLFG